MSFEEKYLKYKNKYLELKKQIGGQPSNPSEVDIIIKKFIEEWNKKQYKQTAADFFIEEIVKNYKTTEGLWNNSYEHILLLLLGEISRIKKMQSKINSTWDNKDIEGITNSLNEYEKLLAILE